MLSVLPPPSKRHTNTIDLIRFLACFFLAVGHVVPASRIGTGVNLFLLSGIVSTMFFGLSGFIVCQTTSFWRDSWRSLAVQRFARLYPVHILGCLPFLSMLVLGIDRQPLSSLATEAGWWVTCLQAFRWAAPGSLVDELNGPAWALTPLLFGGMALPAIRFLGLGQWPARLLAGTLFALVVLRMGIPLLAPYSDDEHILLVRHVDPFPHVLEVFAGGITALLVRRGGQGRLWSFLARDNTLALATLLVFGPVAIAIHIAGRAGGFYTVHGPIFPFVLLFLVAAFLHRGAADRFCRWKWIRTGGDMSIFIYLFHTPIKEIADRSLVRLGFPNPYETWPRAILILSATILVSYLILPFAERARMRIIETLDGRRA